ncbi:GGDEF domain-containing protein [Edaphobacter paludis]|uniref:diguanylate cyclase n=1 Tax=Edaphobacter paludis TaxID=3035702 RepID=A0AAU7DCE0_9BACT
MQFIASYWAKGNPKQFKAMPNIIFQLITLLGILLLLLSFVPLRRIFKILPSGLTRNAWLGLAFLIGFSIVGYLLLFWLNYTEGPDHHEDWLISLICLLASIFVLCVCMISDRTAKEVSRIADLELAVLIDPLTELYNRRHILSLLEKECSRSKLLHKPLSVLLLDIDSFKEINDTLGHQAGDFVLKEFSRLFAAIQNNSGFVGRYGGEEFLILLPDTTRFNAFQAAEQLRYVIESTTMMLESKYEIPVTASIGVATSSSFTETPHDLISLADKALYEAKASGRNNVCMAPQQHAWQQEAKSTLAIPFV